MIKKMRVLALDRMPMPNRVVLSPLSFRGAYAKNVLVRK
jgi:hypothetical protein